MNRWHMGMALALLAPSISATPLSLTETYAYGERMTHLEGCEMADKRLKQRAVAQQCGSFMTGGAMRALGETVDALHRLHFETTGGRVTESRHEILPPVEPLSCTVRSTLTVTCDRGQRDPAFFPVAEGLVSLNEAVFRAGEALRIEVKTPADLQGPAYLTVVVLMPHEAPETRVAKLYPNPLDGGKPLTAGQVLRIPGNDLYTLFMSLPPDRKTAEEALMFIFSRKPVSLPELMSIEQLHAVLSELPLNERRELVKVYRIESRAKSGESKVQVIDERALSDMPRFSLTKTG